MGDLLGSFLRERVSEGKGCWKDSCSFVGTVIDLGCHKWYQSRPLVVRCGSGMNQPEVCGSVTPGAKKAERDSRCTRHGQGAALGKRLGGEA